mmetsp:Transcript_56269/g.127703  ORF Transcript_56269/g.127703 Transcript_56269/m.127703 type:complete len:279 (-) Transcript_56269:404-1240(-)
MGPDGELPRPDPRAKPRGVPRARGHGRQRGRPFLRCPRRRGGVTHGSITILPYYLKWQGLPWEFSQPELSLRSKQEPLHTFLLVCVCVCVCLFVLLFVCLFVRQCSCVFLFLFIIPAVFMIRGVEGPPQLYGGHGGPSRVGPPPRSAAGRALGLVPAGQPGHADQVRLRPGRPQRGEPRHLQQPGGPPVRLPRGDPGAALQGLRDATHARPGLEPREGQEARRGGARGHRPRAAPAARRGGLLALGRNGPEGQVREAARRDRREQIKKTPVFFFLASE